MVANIKVTLTDPFMFTSEMVLAQDTKTSEEYTEETGCEAVWEDVTCTGTDGKIYTYSKEATTSDT
jgi:hypothetical protein